MEKPIDLPNLTDTQKSFDAMRNNLITVNTTVNSLQEDVRDSSKRITKLEEVVITGTIGEIPLKEQVRNHDGYIKDLKYWARFIGGALIIQTIAFFFGVLVALVRFLPLLEALAQKP